MSTASAADAAGPKKGKKKLLVMLVVALVVIAGASGGVVFWLKSKAAAAHAAEEEGDAPEPAAAHAKRDPKAVPAFVPLDVFTVNLADRETERYAQVGITFELSDPKGAEQVKNFMPAIRNNILMLLAHKTSTELLEREGKTKLAREVKNETLRALGYEVEDEPEDDAHADAEEESPKSDKAKKKKRKKRAAPVGPLQAVHFSNFIIQ